MSMTPRNRMKLNRSQLKEIHTKMMYDFHDNCKAKHLFRSIGKLVKTAKETYKEDLDMRRTRLRHLIETEEHGYELEYRREVESRLENTIRQRQEMLVKIRNEKLKQEVEFNKQKKAEQIMNNSDQFRTILDKENLRKTKEIQLIQIEELKQKRLNEKELECKWMGVQNRLNEKFDQMQQYENCLLKSIELKTAKYNLDKYYCNQIPIDQTSDYYEGFGSLMKNDLKIEQDKIMKRKQTDIANNIYNQKQKEFQKQKHCREIEIEGLYNDACKREHLLALQREEEKKSSNRSEIETYLQYVKDLKKELDEEHKKEADLLLIDQNKEQCKELEKHRKWKKQLELNAKKTHQILVEQIREHDRKKYDETILTNEQHLADKEVHRRQNCAEDMKVAKKKEKTLQLANDLVQQAEANRLMACAIKTKDEADSKRVQQYQDHIDALAMKFGQELNTSKIHPNLKLINCSCSEKP